MSDAQRWPYQPAMGRDPLRFAWALDGFRLRYGTWPTDVIAYESSLARLREALGPERMGILEDTMTLHEGPYGFRAMDETGGTYTYAGEGAPKSVPWPSAVERFLVRPPRPIHDRPTEALLRFALENGLTVLLDDVDELSRPLSHNDISLNTWLNVDSGGAEIHCFPVIVKGHETIPLIRVSQLLTAAIRGFFGAAERGECFGFEDKIPKVHGCDVETAYPGRSETFYKFARTFWMWAAVGEEALPRGTPGSLARLCTLGATKAIRKRVFPMRLTDVKPHPDARALFREFCPSMDVEDFYRSPGRSSQ